MPNYNYNNNYYDYDAGVDDDDNYKKKKVKPQRKMNKGFCHLLTGLMHHNGPRGLLARAGC